MQTACLLLIAILIHLVTCAPWRSEEDGVLSPDAAKRPSCSNATNQEDVTSALLTDDALERLLRNDPEEDAATESKRFTLYANGVGAGVFESISLHPSNDEARHRSLPDPSVMDNVMAILHNAPQEAPARAMLMHHMHKALQSWQADHAFMQHFGITPSLRWALQAPHVSYRLQTTFLIQPLIQLDAFDLLKQSISPMTHSFCQWRIDLDLTASAEVQRKQHRAFEELVLAGREGEAMTLQRNADFWGPQLWLHRPKFPALDTLRIPSRRSIWSAQHHCPIWPNVRKVVIERDDFAVASALPVTLKELDVTVMTTTALSRLKIPEGLEALRLTWLDATDSSIFSDLVSRNPVKLHVVATACRSFDLSHSTRLRALHLEANITSVADLLLPLVARERLEALTIDAPLFYVLADELVSAFPNLLSLTLRRSTVAWHPRTRLPPHLRTLVLEDMHIPAMDLGAHHGLRHVTMTRCGLTSLEHIIFPPHVMELNLTDNVLTQLDERLHRLPIRVLTLNGNRLQKLILRHLPSGLRALSARRNRLDEVHLGRLSNLQRLDVSENPIRHIDARQIPLSLHDLRLAGAALRQVDFALPLRPHLEVLHVSFASGECSLDVRGATQLQFGVVYTSPNCTLQQQRHPSWAPQRWLELSDDGATISCAPPLFTDLELDAAHFI